MILTLAGIIVKVIGAFSKVLIARVLGGEGIGLYMMAYPIYQIIVSISAAGIPCGHIYYDCGKAKLMMICVAYNKYFPYL